MNFNWKSFTWGQRSVVFHIVLEIQKCELDVWNFTEKMDNISKNLQGRKKSFKEKFQEKLKKKIKAIA